MNYFTAQSPLKTNSDRALLPPSSYKTTYFKYYRTLNWWGGRITRRSSASSQQRAFFSCCCVQALCMLTVTLIVERYDWDFIPSTWLGCESRISTTSASSGQYLTKCWYRAFSLFTTTQTKHTATRSHGCLFSLYDHAPKGLYLSVSIWKDLFTDTY